MRVRPLVLILLAQVAIAGAFVALVVTDNLPFLDTEDSAGGVSRPTVDRFDGARAFELLERQVRIGPRPAGSAASRRLGGELRALLPAGRFQPVPGGLRNVVGTVPGAEPERVVVVGAHYDTKDIADFVGANDGAAGTAAVVELARTIRPGTVDPTLVFILFDGEESPADAPQDQFQRFGLRGSKVAAPRYEGAEAMILLDFVGERDLRIRRERNSDEPLWERLRAAAGRVGTERVFPSGTVDPIADDHKPFLLRGVPAIDLIDVEFACFHRKCDDLSAVSERSLDAAGETVLELLRTL